MSCILRFYGDFDPAPLVASLTWKKMDSWKKGDPNPHLTGEPRDTSGIQVVVSDAGSEDQPVQVFDAIDFLTRESTPIEMIMKIAGVKSGDLDFGVAQRNKPMYCVDFPARLVELAGKLGIGIQVSLYAVAGVGGFEEEK